MRGPYQGTIESCLQCQVGLGAWGSVGVWGFLGVAVKDVVSCGLRLELGITVGVGGWGCGVGDWGWTLELRMRCWGFRLWITGDSWRDP